jgi:hypothetical protein
MAWNEAGRKARKENREAMDRKFSQLLEENARLQHDLARHQEITTSQQAEIERLWTALGNIALHMTVREMLDDEDGDIEGALDSIIGIARQTLRSTVEQKADHK